MIMKKITYLFLFMLCVGFIQINAQNTRNTLEFDSTDPQSLVNCGASPTYSPAVFTAETWVKIYAGTGTLMSNVEYVNAPGDGAKGFSIRLNGQKAELVMGKGSAAGDWTVLTATDDLVLDTWTHVAATYNGSNAEIFYNGISQGVLATPNPMLVSAQNFYLGEHPTYPNRRLSGQLSDVRVWNIVRSAAEIQSSMLTFLSGTESGLVGNWKLDEGTGTLIHEQVSNTDVTKGTGTTWQLNSVLGISNYNLDNSISVYPNPSNGEFTFKSTLNEPISYQIFDVTGKMVITDSFSQLSNKIDLSNKGQGIYILKATFSGNHITKKLVVQ